MESCRGSFDDKSSVIYVDWEPQDPENPFNWSKARKWTFTAMGIVFTGATAWIAASFAIGIDSMESQLHNMHILSLWSVGVFPFGFSLVPLMTAPLSEVYGRRWVFLISELGFTLLMIPTARSNNITGVIICRFLTGAFGSTGSTLVGGILADIWMPNERGWPMALFASSSFIFSGCGPGLMGLVAYNLDWRWIQYVQIIAMGVAFIISAIFLRETRGPLLLSRRAARLRKETGSERYQCKADEGRVSLKILFKTSMLRPIDFLFTEPIVTWLCVYVGFAWGNLWGFFQAIPIITQKVYGFNVAEQGLSFFSIAIGAVVAMLLVPWQERKYKKNVARRGPEARLYITCLGGFIMFAGGMIITFSEGRGHWVGPLFGVGTVTIGIFCIFYSTFAYMADAYMTYASSAIAAQGFARNIVACSFPLWSPYMYTGMADDIQKSIQWAALLMALVAAVLTVVPFILFFYGEQIRKRSRVVQDLAREQALQQQGRLDGPTIASGNSSRTQCGAEDSQNEAQLKTDVDRCQQKV